MKFGARAGVGLVTVLLLFGLVLAPAAWITSGSLIDKTDASEASNKELMEPGTSFHIGVRPMPIIDPNGQVAQSFPNGAGLDDPKRVRQVIVERATAIGLGDDIGRLLEGDITGGNPRNRYSPPVEYPFEYTTIDPVVDGLLMTEVARGRRREIVDLASLLTVAAAKDLSLDELYSGAALAYSILSRIRDVENSCDVQLSLAFLVSLGSDPHRAGTEKEFAEAIDLCAGDPTPLWWLGQSRLMRALDSSDAREARALVAYADAPFEDLRREFPESPLGWAGSADLRLDLAATNENIGWRSFESRQWRREALDLYLEARSRSDHPGLLAGHARALSGLGRHDEAIEMIGQLIELVPTKLVYRILHTKILQAARRHEEAASSIIETDMPPLPTGLRLTPSTYDMPASWVPSEPVPFRFGLSEARGVVVPDANSPAFGGAWTLDHGFLPVHRWEYDGLDTSNGWCRSTSYMINLIVAGQSRLASTPYRVRPDLLDEHCVGSSRAALTAGGNNLVDLLRAVAAAELDSDNRPDPTGDASEISVFYDLWQDLWRWAGDLDRAEEVVQAWGRDLPSDSLSRQRLGEIRFLQGRYESASEAFADYQSTSDVIPDRQLQLGASLEADGQVEAARRVYTRLLRGLPANGDSSYGHSQLGTLELRAGNFKKAVKDLRASITAAAESNIPPRGAQENNLSIAYTKLGKPKQAIAAAKDALKLDHANPVFIDTLAFAQNFGPNPSAAIETYRRAVQADPGLFPSWNNMAVLLAKDGQRDEALKALRRAIEIRPKYAVAWKNLGIILKDSAGDFLSSQGALARASHYQRSLRGSDNKLEFDTRVYDSGLDVSKPVAPDWTFSKAASEPVNLFTLTMALLVAFRLSWTLGLDKATGTLTARFVALSPRRSRRLRRLWAKQPATWAVVVAVVVLGLPVLRSGASLLEVLTFVCGTTVLAVLPLIARSVYASRSNQDLGHFSWPPGMIAGLVVAPFNLSFAPPACLEGEDRKVSSRARWVGPISLAIAAVGFTMLAAFYPAPVVRNLAMASVTVLGSALIPVKPFDGAAINRKSVDIVITTILTLATIAFALKWI